MKTKLTLFIIGLVITNTIYSQTQCICGDCDNSFGITTYTEGDKYVGEFLNQKRDGFGTYYYKSGAIYNGYLMYGAFDGYGFMRYSNGDTYLGEFDNYIRSGYGYYKFADGDVDLGTFSNGTFQPTTRIYDSKCISGDCSNGKGRYIFKSGEQYNGDWKYNLRNGSGINLFGDGSIYSGEWVNDKRNGYGMQLYTISSEKLIFSGKYVDDSPVSGSMRYKDGRKFSGSFTNGKPDGSGTMYYCDGSYLVGVWANGEYTGEGQSYSGTSNTSSGTDSYSKNYDFETFSWTQYNLKFEVPKDLNIVENSGSAFKATKDKVNFSMFPTTLAYSDSISIKKALKDWAIQNNLEMIPEPSLLVEETDYERYSISTYTSDEVIMLVLMVDKSNRKQGFYVWVSFKIEAFDMDYFKFLDSFENITKSTKNTQGPLAPSAP